MKQSRKVSGNFYKEDNSPTLTTMSFINLDLYSILDEWYRFSSSCHPYFMLRKSTQMNSDYDFVDDVIVPVFLTLVLEILST